LCLCFFVSFKYSHKVDIWSIGVVLLEIVENLDGFINTVNFVNLSNQLTDNTVINNVIKKCLQFNSNDRYNSPQILNLINNVQNEKAL
jgi:serine/threonine protein kinase